MAAKKARTVAVIDSETDPFKYGRIPRPFVWGFYDGTRYERFDQPWQLIEYLREISADEKLIVYAHNGGKFDYFYLFEAIDIGSSIKVINGRIAAFTMGNVEFRDSYSILPVPLSAYEKDQIDYAIFERDLRDIPANRKKIEAYLYTDCLHLFNFVSKFIEQYGLHLTAAGTALATWQKMCDIKAPNDFGGFVYNQIKPFYYGGRCESFYWGKYDKTPFSLVDINSAYPFAMMHDHPISLDPEWIENDVAKGWQLLSEKQRTGSFVVLRGVSKGVFPYRGDDGSLYFPSDDFEREYHVTGWEYLAAIDTDAFDGYMVKFCYFGEFLNFQTYVNHFYALKKSAKAIGDRASELFAKLLMNSLYGKFASNPEEYFDYISECTSLIGPGGVTEDGWQFCSDLTHDTCLVCKPQPEEKRRYYNLATGASVTGFVRAYLWRSMSKCGGVLYCDTDSIAAVDVSALTISKELGDWSHEGDFDLGAFCGRKLYAMREIGNADKWKCASKGVRLTPKELVQIAEGQTVEYFPDAPTFSIYKGPHFVSRKVKLQKRTLAPPR